MKVVQMIQSELKKNNIKPSRMMSDLGFSTGLFSQWKSGKQKPSADKITKIAEYLKVSVDYLMYGIKSFQDTMLTDMEQSFFEMYMSLDEEEKKKWFEMLKAVSNMDKEGD